MKKEIIESWSREDVEKYCKYMGKKENCEYRIEEIPCYGIICGLHYPGYKGYLVYNNN